MLFGRIFSVSIGHKAGIANNFTYPITPAPVFLCQFDGCIKDTKDADKDNEVIQYKHWIDDEISNFNDNNNED
ncbi:hypothetical protein TNCT_7671 [Trichonephila clavata]|uniref:Uncharacterized protein n=1 Tax=Trichonephila clavata TaxID=2740835 RepID=A0A8X6LK35_TRICU|nr:hypothetical protein TNCT_7671 [Trichonephila clavata]